MLDLDRLNGVYVGQLDADELAEFNRRVREGTAYRSYEGFSATLLGIAKVRLLPQEARDA